MGRPHWPHHAACGKQVRWRQLHCVRCPLQPRMLLRPIRMHMLLEILSQCDAARKPIAHRRHLQQEAAGWVALMAVHEAYRRLQQPREGRTHLLGTVSSSLRQLVDLAVHPRPPQSAHPFGGVLALPGLQQRPRGTPSRRTGSGLWGRRCATRVPRCRLIQAARPAQCHRDLAPALARQGLAAREHHRSHQSAAGWLPPRAARQWLVVQSGDRAVPPQGCMATRVAQTPQLQLVAAAPRLQCSPAHPAGVLLHGVHLAGVQTQQFPLPRHLLDRQRHHVRKNGQSANPVETQWQAKRPLIWPARQMLSFSGRWTRFGANSWNSVCLDQRLSGWTSHQAWRRIGMCTRSSS